MSSIPAMLGMAGGVGGTGIAAPSGASPEQLQAAYNNTQDALQQQQSFVNALNAQNGLQNQQNTFKSLQDVSQGKGANPAQAMLNQATGQNVSNQAALMAGQRGSSANVGMMARQAANQGASTQQQAAGQSATLQSNQQLNALGQMGNMANTQVANQQAGIAQLAGQGLQQQSNLMGLQSSANSANAQLAGARMGQQAQMTGNIMGAMGASAGMMKAEGGEVQRFSEGTVNAPVQAQPVLQPQAQPQVLPAPSTTPEINNSFSQAPAQSVAAPLPAANAPKSKVGQYFADDSKKPGSQDYFASGQAGKDFGAGMHNLFKNMFSSSPASTPAHSGPTEDSTAAFMRAPGTTDSSGVPTAQADYDMIHALPDEFAFGGEASDDSGPNIISTIAKIAPMIAMAAAEGGKVPALVSPGEVSLSPKDVAKVKKGANPMQVGEKIPGKPVVPGPVNSYANDVVPKKLEEGGIVIPRSITQGPNPHWAAMKFVHATLAKSRHKSKK